MPVKDFDQNLTQALCWLFACDVTDLEKNDFLNGPALEGIETSFDFGFYCPLGYEGMKAVGKSQTVKQRDTIARLCALHHFWNQVMESNPDKYLVFRTELPLPDATKTNPVSFMRLWLPEPMRVMCYGRAESKLPKPLMVKYDGDIKNAKSFIDRVKSTLASGSSNMLHCLLDRDFARANPDMNRNLYAWTLSYVDERTRKIYWDPHKETGDGHEAFFQFTNDPGLEHYLEIRKQEAETQLHKLCLSKCKGKLLDYVNQFRTLVAETEEMFDEVKQIELFLGGLDDKDYKEEADQLYKMAKRNTLLQTINAVLTYEADVLSRRKKIEGLKGGTKQPPTKDNAGHSRGNKRGGDGNKAQQNNQGKNENDKAKPSVPRIVREDWKELDSKQQGVLIRTGKLPGYKIFPDPNSSDGLHRCVKDNNQGGGKKAKGQKRARLTQEQDVSYNGNGMNLSDSYNLSANPHTLDSVDRMQVATSGTKRMREEDTSVAEGPLGQVLRDLEMEVVCKAEPAILGDDSDSASG